MSVWVLLLSLLWSLVEVHSQQTFPQVSFYGQTLANHSYVVLSHLGYDYYESVWCHTDLNTCCSGHDGAHRGDWYFPNGTRLPFSGYGDIFESRSAQSVDIRSRNYPTSPVGIYRCEIPTNAVHNDTDTSVRERVYVGLYTYHGGNYLIVIIMLGFVT